MGNRTATYTVTVLFGKHKTTEILVDMTLRRTSPCMGETERKETGKKCNCL